MQMVRKQFEEMFPGQLASIYVAHDTSQLSALLGYVQDACRRLQVVNVVCSALWIVLQLLVRGTM